MTTLAAILLMVLQEPAKAGAPDKVDQAVARGLKYFITAQNPAEGWISDTGANRTSMTSLAILAMAATGHQPTDETPEGQTMKKALAYVLKPENQDAQGFLGGRDGSRMYGHGIATLMLSEMVGMGVDAQMDQLLRERCKKAVDLVLRSQSLQKDARNAGGWRYMPDSRDSDLSATVWQLMALRSARPSWSPGSPSSRASATRQAAWTTRPAPRGSPLSSSSERSAPASCFSDAEAMSPLKRRSTARSRGSSTESRQP